MYKLLGFIFLGCAVFGVVMPLVPATPFLLLALFFFSRSSPKWHSYIMEHPVFGMYIRNYRRGEMRRSHKTFTLMFMWVSMGWGMFMSGFHPWAVGAMLLIGSAVTLHLCLLAKPASDTIKS